MPEPRTGAPDPHAFDLGNPLIGPAPCEAVFTLVANRDTGDQAIVMTIHDVSGTHSYWLDRDQAQAWRDGLDGKLAKMPRLGAAPPVRLEVPDGAMRLPRMGDEQNGHRP